MNRHAEMIKQLEDERIAATKRRELELQRYREQQAQELLRRKQAEELARLEPIDQGCPILNMQGCDVNHDARTKAQVMQQQDWLNAQVQERMAREEQERLEQLAYEQAEQEINEKLAKLMKLKEEQEAEARRKLRETHLAQQEEMRLRKEWERLRDDRMAQQEIEHMMNSALLNELSRTRRDNIHRAIPAEFKGFNQSQRQAILDEQRRQIEEMKLRREQEQREEQAWVDRMEDDRRKLIMLQREADLNKKTAQLALQREREAQAHSNTVRSEYLNNVVYRNEISDEFFNKFGKSCR